MKNETIEQRLERIEDRIAIEKLQALYWYCLDLKKWNDLEQCFTDDFTFYNLTTGGKYKGKDGMLSTMKSKFTDDATTSHHGHQHWIDFSSNTEAVGYWALEDDLYDAGKGGEFKGRAYYENTYTKSPEGIWKIKEMKLTYLRGEGNIKKRLEDTSEAYKVFLL